MGRNSAFASPGFLVALFLTVVAGPSWAQQLITYQEVKGDTAGDQLGYSLAGIGDVNADNVPDFAVGSNQDLLLGVAVGSVKVFSGKDGTLLHTNFGTNAGDQLGFSLAATGDIDHDGAGDFVVGAPFADLPGKGNAGIAKLISGKTGAVLRAFAGNAANDQFGFSVAGPGDVNLDGTPDVLIGANRADSPFLDVGNAILFSGLDGSVLRQWNGDSSGDQFGYSVAGPGDVDRDGYPDLLIGIPFDDGHGMNAGGTKLFSGKDGVALLTWSGGSANDNCGVAVSSAGDVNFDGYIDLLLGANRDDSMGFLDNGSVRVVSGKDGVNIYQFFGDAGNDQIGLASAGIGDINLDGAADILVGIRLADAGGMADSGKAKIYSGATGILLYTVNGEASGDQLGFAVCPLGDLNADNVPEFLLGVAASDPNGANSGKALVLGLPYQQSIQGKLQETTTIGGTQQNGGLSLNVESIGDFDGDQMPDFLTANPFEGSLDNDGVVRIFSGRDYSTLLEVKAPTIDEEFGKVIAPAGDLDGDGKMDLLIAADSGIPANYADHLRAISGADGSTIFYYSYYESISALESLEDLDGDGRPEFAVGFNTSLLPFGMVHIYSGATGALIASLEGTTYGADFGRAILRLGDMNNDGFSDFLVSAPNHASDRGKVSLISGENFSSLLEVEGATGDRLGASLTAMGDFNGDGFEDFAAGAYNYNDYTGTENGGNYIRVISGADGSSLLQIDGNVSGTVLGHTIENVGDWNSDGIPDLAAGLPWANANGFVHAGVVRIYSGADGSVLHEWQGGSKDELLGETVCGLGDLGNDGICELAVAIPGSDATLPEAGAVRVYSSSAKSSLIAKSTNTLSLTQGGSQTFQIGIDGPAVGKAYIMLGSISGTTPGIPIGTKTLPLNPDDYFNYTLSNPLGPTMTSGFGFLGASGTANPTLTLPAGLPAELLGATVHHAFAIFSIGGGIEFVSNPVFLKFVP